MPAASAPAAVAPSSDKPAVVAAAEKNKKPASLPDDEIMAERLTPDAGMPPGPAVAGPAAKRARVARVDLLPAGPDIPGAPLAIPGAQVAVAAAEVDLEAKRVARFKDEGGARFTGRVLDADSGAGVADAQVEAWMGNRSIRTDTDGTGAFQLAGLAPGSRVTFWITATSRYVQERIEVAVPADKAQLDASFKLLPRAAVGGHAGGIGVFLARRSARTVVSGLDAFGPAERAGLATGDAIVAIGKRDVADLGPGAIEALLRGPIGEPVALTVMRKGTRRTVELRRASR